MNRLFVAFDGDGIGSKVGQSVLMDDAQALHETSSKIEAASKAIRNWVESNGGQMISSGGDEGTFIIDPSLEEHLEELRSLYQKTSGATVTFGVGLSLSQAGKSLIAGKLMGKDITVKYDDQIEAVLADAHSQAQSGEADEETQKQDEHYLSHLSDEGGLDMADESEHDDLEHSDLEHDDSEFDQTDSPDQHLENVDEYDMSPSVSDYDDQEITDEGAEHSQDMVDAVAPEEDHEEGHQDFEEDYEQPHHDLQDQSEEAIQAPEDQESFEDEESVDIPENESVESQEDPEEMIAQAAGDPQTADEEDAFPGAAPGEGEDHPDQSTPEDEAEPADMDYSHLEGDEETQQSDEEQPSDFDLLSELLSESGSTEELKERVASILEKFKANRDTVVAMKSQNPELYEPIVLMLKQMVDMAKQLFEPGTEEGSEQSIPEDIPTHEPDLEEDSELPKTMGR